MNSQTWVRQFWIVEEMSYYFPYTKITSIIRAEDKYKLEKLQSLRH